MGALHILLSNTGHKSPVPPESHSGSSWHGHTEFIDDQADGKLDRVHRSVQGAGEVFGAGLGVNWRTAAATLARPATAGGALPAASQRPKNRVLARPLSSGAPELNKLLDDYRSNAAASVRSLTANREKTGGGGLHTLSLDEMTILFRRYPTTTHYCLSLSRV